jgi:hypothetical protein
MNEKPTGKVWLERDTYVTNRSRFTPDELAPYGNQWVAWSADGSKIVAHHEDLLQVTEQVKAAGYDSEDVLREYIPPGGEVETLL